MINSENIKSKRIGIKDHFFAHFNTPFLTQNHPKHRTRAHPISGSKIPIPAKFTWTDNSHFSPSPSPSPSPTPTPTATLLKKGDFIQIPVVEFHLPKPNIQPLINFLCPFFHVSSSAEYMQNQGLVD